MPAIRKKEKVQANTLDSFLNITVRTHPAKKTSESLLHLNLQQKNVYQRVLNGESIFFTGSAGTGKSLLLREVIGGLRKKWENAGAVAVTASTGIAACNINGCTIHSWGTIAPNMIELKEQLKIIRKNLTAKFRWINARVLVIDEVSMIDAELFTRLDEIARALRKPLLPFGGVQACFLHLQFTHLTSGIQLVITGDFLQLPPVTKPGKPLNFAFESEAWKLCIPYMAVLTQVFRQKDQTFVNLLNEVRLGTVSFEAAEHFAQLARPLPARLDGLVPTELFARRSEVAQANSRFLDKLPSPPQLFCALDQGNAISDRKRDDLLESVMAPQELCLKVKAQVMLVKNIDHRLINGTVGTVLGFHYWHAVTGDDYPNSAPSHIRNVKMQAGGCRPVRPTEDVASRIEAVPKGKGSWLKKDKLSDRTHYPLVLFPATGDHGPEAVLLVQEQFRIEDHSANWLAKRHQVPLVLAWAISIHKSQGLSLERMVVDLGGVFEKGQTYVALSRASALDGLQVLNFTRHRVTAHPTVLEWQKQLTM